MQNNSKRNNNSRVSDVELNSVDAEESQSNFFEGLPLEVTLRIFSLLDVQSLCRASMTCWSWNYKITANDSLWKPHCLAIRAVCKEEIDNDLKSGYSWRLLRFETNSPSSNMLHCLMMMAYLFQDTLQRNYQKSKLKLEWLSGRYSNICSPINLPEKIMYPMDAETWGEILEAELKRCKNHKDTIALRV